MGITRFLSRDVNRMRIYMHMIHQLANTAPQLSTEIETLSEDILNKWEQRKHDDPNQLIREPISTRKRYISDIMDDFRQGLKNKVRKDSQYQECLRIVKDTFYQIFDV